MSGAIAFHCSACPPVLIAMAHIHYDLLRILRLFPTTLYGLFTPELKMQSAGRDAGLFISTLLRLFLSIQFKSASYMVFGG